MKDFCSSVSGFRVNESARTVELVQLDQGKWIEHDEKRKYPLSPLELPEAPNVTTSLSAWGLAWESLRRDKPQQAKELFSLLTAGYPGQH
jgi:hypothetical protein